MKVTNQCAVVIHYDFDDTITVILCENYKEASQFIKEDFENEKKIDTEENVWEIDKELTVCDEDHAVLATIYPSGTEPQCTYWTIAANTYTVK